MARRFIAIPTTSKIPNLPIAATEADYDDYFHLRRSGSDLEDWTSQCLVLGSDLTADLRDSGLSQEACSALISGLMVMYRTTLERWLLAMPRDEPERKPGNETDRAPVADAMRKWKLGHQAFHLYLVTTITLLDKVRSHVYDWPLPRIAATLRELTIMFEAATASMIYASDFDKATYNGVIRPSMMPPETPPGFSGSLNADHQNMKAAFQALANTFVDRFGESGDGWPPTIKERWHELKQARAENQRHHIFICRRFVGEQPSLLQAEKQMIEEAQ
jgi:hypothetical protein